MSLFRRKECRFSLPVSPEQRPLMTLTTNRVDASRQIWPDSTKSWALALPKWTGQLSHRCLHIQIRRTSVQNATRRMGTAESCNAARVLAPMRNQAWDMRRALRSTRKIRMAPRVHRRSSDLRRFFHPNFVLAVLHLALLGGPVLLPLLLGLRLRVVEPELVVADVLPAVRSDGTTPTFAKIQGTQMRRQAKGTSRMRSWSHRHCPCMCT